LIREGEKDRSSSWKAERVSAEFKAKVALHATSRSAFCASSEGDNSLKLALMRVINAQFLQTQWHGSRQIARHLRQ